MPVALGVELVDELVDGTKGAALPAIRSGLHLSYGQIGLLIAVPLIAGSVLELPLGLVAGDGRRRRLAVLAGGVVFTGALVAVALAHSFAGLLVGFTVFFPASGAFVSLSQSALMDADPARQQPHMAAWNLAGSAGAVAGPLLLALVLAAGGDWRSAYLLLAAAAAVALIGAATFGGRLYGVPAHAPGAGTGAGIRSSTLAAIRALRDVEVLRWVALTQISDLLLDVLTGFVGIYLVDVVHATPAQAALGVAIRLAAGLAGDAAFVAIAGRVSGPAVLAATAAAACAVYPAFLLVPGLAAKLALLAVLSVITACWYPAAQAGLYGSLPGRSGVAVFLSSAAGLAGAAGPLAVGFIAQRAGLEWALAALMLAPVSIAAIFAPRRRRGRAAPR